MSLIVSKTNLSLNNITKTILLFLTMTIISCESSGIYEPELENNKQELGTIKLEYEFENVLPIYNQTIMVTTFNDKFIFYGWHGTIMIVNAYMKGPSSWSVIPASNDTMTWRWDGTIAKVNNQCYIFALPHMSLSNPLYPKYYNIVKLNPINYEVTALPELLPFFPLYILFSSGPASTTFAPSSISLSLGYQSSRSS